jgi:alpha-tubulin suppressor-like RCC1 family protein
MWGNNPYGQLGLGDIEKRLLPTKVKISPKIERIACGSWHTMALDINGNVWNWGRNENGMLGNGNEENSMLPIKLEIKNVTDIGAGCFQSIAVNDKNEVWVWGENWNGQLGVGNFDRMHKPVKSLFNLKDGIVMDDEIKKNLEPEAKVVLLATKTKSNNWIFKHKKLSLSLLLNICLFLGVVVLVKNKFGVGIK